MANPGKRARRADRDGASAAGDPGEQMTRMQRRARMLILIAIGVVVIAAVAVGIWSVTKATRKASGDAPELLTAAGYDGLVADIEREFPSELVTQIGVFERHAVVYIPVDATSDRYRSFVYRNGDWRDLDSGTERAAGFAPDQVTGRAVATAVADLRTRVADPTSTSIIVRAKGEDGACLQGDVANDAQEQATVRYTCEGVALKGP